MTATDTRICDHHPDCTLPYGVCHCGCGEATKVITRTDLRQGYVAGRPNLYRQGHNAKRSKDPEKVARWQQSQAPTTRKRKAEASLADRQHELAVILYDLAAQFANEEGTLLMSLDDIARRGGTKGRVFFRNGRPARWLLTRSWQYLGAQGCVRNRGPRMKVLLHRPDEAPVEDQAQDFLPAIVSPEAPEVSVPEVTGEQIGSGIAHGMWQRYEWAVSEIGRLSSKLEEANAEIEHLRAQLDAKDLSIQDIAVRMLTAPTAKRGRS